MTIHMVCVCVLLFVTWDIKPQFWGQNCLSQWWCTSRGGDASKSKGGGLRKVKKTRK